MRRYGKTEWRQLDTLRDMYPSLTDRFDDGEKKKVKPDDKFQPAHDTKVFVVEVTPAMASA